MIARHACNSICVIFTVSLQYSVQAFIGVLAIADVNWRTKFGEPGNKANQQLSDYMTN